MSDTSPRLIADVLRRAADAIEADGHWTGGFGESGHDAHDAIILQVAEIDWPASYELSDAALDALMRHIGWPKTLEDLFRWNDEATYPRVVATMRACAAALEDASLPADVSSSADVTTSREQPT